MARNLANNATARAAADAGVQRAILDLIGSLGKLNGTGKFRADGTVYDWRFGESTVQISIQDERGKIDLNEASEAILAALFEWVGVDRGKAQSLAAAIADFRDADDLRRLNGAEKADYRTAGLVWGPKNAPFEATEELQQVSGMTAEIYERVAAHLTIYTVGVINPALAGERLTGFLQRADFRSLIFANSPGLVFSIRAEAKCSIGAVFVREAVVQLNEETTVPVLILAWRQGVASRHM